MVSEEEKENNLMMLRKNYSGHYNLKQDSEIETGDVLKGIKPSFHQSAPLNKPK